MKPIGYILGLLTIAVVGCGGDGGGSTGGSPGTPPTSAFSLSRAATPGTDPDPAGSGGEVIIIDNEGTNQEGGDPLSAGSIHAATLPATLDDLTGAFSVRYYLAAGKDCLAGTPRAHIRLDTDADAKADVELWGSFGPDPNAGASCPDVTWTDQNFTDGVARWSASTGGPVQTWADLLADFAAGTYTITDLFLVEDAEFYDPTPDEDPADNTVPLGITVGVTAYDDFTVGPHVLADHADATLAP